jgi:4-hydroxybenzoate polyprenyltransferase
MPMQDMVRLCRPKHWIKNFVVVMPILFGMRFGDMRAWAHIAIAFAAFCLASSFSYVVNDIRDREADKNHPKKKNRPIACGAVSVKTASVMAVVLFASSCIMSLLVSPLLLMTVGVYLGLQILYTVQLKDRVLIDVICIALGFVLRATAGAVAIGVAVSPWLFICMFTICLFMGFCKRYNEYVTFGDVAAAHKHRKTLLEYTPELLTHLITISAGVAVVAFLLYGVSESTVERFGTDYFIYTLPLVVYGVFRFAMLSMKGTYADPTDLILRDRPFQITVVIWMLMALCIIVWGSKLSALIPDVQ